MARNRMIKPDFFESEKLSRVSLDSNYLFIGLWVYGDDYGVHDYSIRSILGDIFRHRSEISEKKCEKMINDLLSVGVLIHATVNGKPFLVIKSWDEHQNVPNPSKRRLLSDSELEKIRQIYCNYDSSLDGIREYVDSNDGLIRVYFLKEKEKEKYKGGVVISEKKIFIPPTKEEFKSYCSENGFENIAERAYKYYADSDWKDSRGRQVLSWKGKLQSVWFKDENRSKKKNTSGIYC